MISGFAILIGLGGALSGGEAGQEQREDGDEFFHDGYSDLFGLQTRKRKNRDGSLIRWQPSDATIRLPEFMPSAKASMAAELEESRRFYKQLEGKGLAEPKD